MRCSWWSGSWFTLFYSAPCFGAFEPRLKVISKPITPVANLVQVIISFILIVEFFFLSQTGRCHSSCVRVLSRSELRKKSFSFLVFGRPFVKRFALCYRTVVLSVCPVCGDVGVLWLNGWMDQHEIWHGSKPRSHCVRWGPSSPSPKVHNPQFSAHVCCGQTTG